MQERYEIYYRRRRFIPFIGTLVCFGLFYVVNSVAETGEIMGVQMLARMVRHYNFGALMTAAICVLATLMFLNAFLRRGKTIYGDPEGISFLATSRELGPFPWSAIRRVQFVKSGGMKRIAFSFKDLTLLDRRPLKCRSLYPAPEETHLQMHEGLFDVPLARVAQ